MQHEPLLRYRPTRVRVVSWTVLAIVGAAATLTFLFGDQVLRGLGLAGLLAGSALSCLLAWRENRMAVRRRHARALGEALMAAELMNSERARHRAVVSVLSQRLAALGTRAADAQRRVSTLRQELSTLRGNYEALRLELELQATLESDAKVIEFARASAPVDAWATAQELWNRDPAVVKQLA